jgi:Protein of unknown function (DUF3810)
LPRDSRLPSRSKSKAAKSDVRSRSTRTAKGGRPTFGWWPSAALIVAALCLAFVTLPAPTVERLYARGCYPAFQPFLTSLSSLVPIAVFDLLIVGLAAWAISRVYPVLRAGRGDRVRCAVIAFVDFAAGASVVYLAFLAAWGLNYRRLPLESQMNFASGRVTQAAVQSLATRSVQEINRLYAPAHADPAATASLQAVRVRLAPAFAQAQRDLGAATLATPARPKAPLIAPFFRWATVDGMVNPFGLEVLINPDVLPIERPYVVAHEWGHIAGWAREGEAGYVGWLTCLRGDDAARYSAWVSLFLHLRGELPRAERARLDSGLAAGPLRDFGAIRERLERGRPAVQRASWRAYDSFLKANRVDEGIRSYDDIVSLVIGIATDADGRPRRRDE